MPSLVAKNYIKHPKTDIDEAHKIASDYAHEALKTLSSNKVLDEELREEVKRIIDENLPNSESEPFRKLIQMHFVEGQKMEQIAKQLGVSLPQAYDWRSECIFVVARKYLPEVLAKTFKSDFIRLFETDPEMVAAVAEANNLIPASKRGRPSKT